METTPATPEKKPGIRWGRLIFRLVLGGAALLILAIVVGLLVLPGIIKTQIETIGSKTTGATVKVGSVSLSVFGGSLYLNNFSISAPEGSASKDLITWKRAGGNLSLGSLRTDTIVVPRIAVDGLRVNLDVDAKGTQSLKTFLDTMKKIADEAAVGQTAEEKTAPKTKLPSLRINEIVATDTKVQLNDAYAGDAPLDSSIVVESARLANIYIPAEYLNNPQGYTEVSPNITRFTMTGLSLFTPKTFSKPEVLSNKTFVFAIDAGTMLGTLKLPVIIIDEVKADALDVFAEVRDVGAGPMPQNLQQFQTITMNATLPNGMPRKFPPLTPPKTTETKSDKSFFSSIGDSLDTTKAEPVAETEQAPVPPEKTIESYFKSLTVKDLQLTALNFENLDKTNPDMNVVFRSGTLTGKNITFPHEPGSEGLLRISGQPRSEQARFTSEIKGGLADLSPERVLKITASGQDIPLKGIRKISDGVLTFNLDAEVKEEAVFGTMGVKVKDFNMKDATITEQITMVKPMQAMSAAGAPELNVPFRAKLKKGSNINQIFQQIGNAVVQSILKQVMNAFDPAKEAVKGVTDQAKKEAEKVQNSVNDALKGNKSVDDAVKSATDSVNSISDDVNNLFGGSKKKKKE